MTQMGNSNIYRVNFPTDQLPEDGEGREWFAEHFPQLITGEEEVSGFLQEHVSEPICQLTMSVPLRLEEALRRLEQAGLRPVFQEAAAPFVQDTSCTMPLSFQLRHFGLPLDPRSIQNHPLRQEIIAETLERHLREFPEAARNILNWVGIEAHDENEDITIHWEDAGREEPA